MRFSNHARRTLLVAAGIATLLAGSSVADASTSANQSDPVRPKPGTTVGVDVPTENSARMRAQDKARSAAHTIRWAVERSRAAGFTGIELYDGGVRLYYRGTPPAAVLTAVADARRAAAVDIRPATYSLGQLRAASERMVRHMKAHPNGPAHRVSIPVDGRGLRVGVDTDRQAVAAASRSLPNVGVPVEIVGQDRVHQKGRFNDWNPFYGGAKILADDGPGCTAGFGVKSGTQEYLLTAGHCGFPGQGWRNGDRSRWIGTATHENVGQDLLMIAADAGSFIFTGVGASTTATHVYAWDWVYTGEELCSSGAVTTWLCGHVVIDAGNTSYCDTDPYGNWECYGGLIWSEQEDGAEASRGGDSGGPVVLPTTSGIVAKGIISGSGGDDLVWQDFATAWQLWGITPVT